MYPSFAGTITTEAHMKRWHEDLFVTLRNLRNKRKHEIERNKDSQHKGAEINGKHVWVSSVGEDPYVLSEYFTQAGRFRKKDAFDCGKSKCYICHNDKLPKRTKHEQELLSDLDFREQLREIQENNAT